MPLDTPPGPRHDLYRHIHKGLRHFMADTLLRLGQAEAADPDELRPALAQLQELLDLCAAHLRHENDFLHTALEARRPGASALLGLQHEAHLEAIAELGRERLALLARPEPAALLRLYLQVSRFMAENFEHMLHEETHHNSALWALYSDAELTQLHQRLVAAIRPEELLRSLRWMLPALNAPERAELLASMPPPVRAVVLDVMRPHLDAGACAKLDRALQTLA